MHDQPIKKGFFLQAVPHELPCPHCKVFKWLPLSAFNPVEPDYWEAKSNCLECKGVFKWGVNPDIPFEHQKCDLMKILT